MAKNIYGDGSKTYSNGLKFEQETDLRDALLKIPRYAIDVNRIFFNGNFIGILASKHDLYRVLLEPNGVNYKEIISKKLLPDEAIYLERPKTVFIIEKKFQNVAGSVDEKLQTCVFKKRQYSKLFSSLGIRVEYLYIFNDWFSHPQYKDVRDFILENNCHYFFNEIPLNFLDLPHMN